MNNQAPEKKYFDLNGQLEVHSIFYTIQGEGPFAGFPAVFIRLAGCNLACPHCDTDYTSVRTLYSAQAAFDAIIAACPRGVPDLVVITGGEPLRQNITPLIELLHKEQIVVQVETNGTLYQNLPEDTVIVCSPKIKHIHELLAKRVTIYKYVLCNGFVNTGDGLPDTTLGQTSYPLARPPAGFSGSVYVQPEDSKNTQRNVQNLKAAVHSSLCHGHILCLQLHKIAELP